MRLDSESSAEFATYGFLSVVEEPSAGMVGGLLVVDFRGRPLEFHCTTPVLPSRADEILCGATLRSVFYCERLGTALLAKSKRLDLLLVNHLELWPMADTTSTPVVMVEVDQDSPEDSPCGCLDRLPPETRPDVQRHLDELERHINLGEPFDRIEEAIRETGLLANEQQASSSEDEEPYDLAA